MGPPFIHISLSTALLFSYLSVFSSVVCVSTSVPSLLSSLGVCFFRVGLLSGTPARQVWWWWIPWVPDVWEDFHFSYLLETVWQDRELGLVVFVLSLKKVSFLPFLELQTRLSTIGSSEIGPSCPFLCSPLPTPHACPPPTREPGALQGWQIGRLSHPSTWELGVNMQAWRCHGP